MTMRTLALFGILLSIFVPPALAQSRNASFTKGNEAYVAAAKAEGEAAVTGYRTAADNYRAAIAESGDSWAAHFNLGNALFKLGYYGEAVLEYERAEAIDPLRPETALNLAVARQAAGLAPQRPQGWIETLGLRLPLNAWLWATAVGGWGFLALLILPLLHGGHKLVTVTGTVTMFALACCAALGVMGWHLHAQWRIVTTADAALRSAPDQDASSLRTMKAGTGVKTMRSYEDWLFVTTEQSDQGWIYAENATQVWNR